jgi:hypothetical protein
LIDSDFEDNFLLLRKNEEDSLKNFSKPGLAVILKPSLALSEGLLPVTKNQRPR